MTDGKLHIDLETFSTVDLRNATPYRYAEDPRFLILMGSYSLPDSDEVVDVESQEQLLDEVGELVRDNDVIKVAHNAPFERICFSRVLGLRVGKYLDPRSWDDTQARAGVHGWPQKLATLAKALGADPKDEAGTALINWFCKPDRKGKRRMPADHQEKWAAFVRYCHQDVVTLIDVDRLLPDFPNERERLVYLADQLVNDTGMRLDLDLIRAAAEAAELNNMEHELQLGNLTGLAKPNNPTTLREWLAKQETHNGKRLKLPDLRSETVEDRLAKLDDIGEPAHSPLRQALELRQELAGTATKKFEAALYAVSRDGRMRGSFRYFGAHTGRWSGRGAQPQNLTRESFSNDADVALTVAELLDGDRVSPLDLKRLVRPMFVGTPVLTVFDYRSIEAIVLAWVAGEQWVLDAFLAGRDLYVETAERMGGLTRSQGKIAVLALGYNGGANSLKAMAGSGFYLNPNTGQIIDSGSLGQARGELSPGQADIVAMDDQQIRERLVLPWRRANPHTVQLWQDLGDAFGDGGQAGRIYVDHVEDQLGRCARLWLPSGRAIHYHGIKWERYVVIDPKTGRPVRKEGWRYANPKDPFNPRMRIGTYGGRLAENVTQGIARDVLADAVVRLVDNGYPVVGHVHDEALVDSGDNERIEELAKVPPAWGPDLPVDVESFVTERYKKA